MRTSPAGIEMIKKFEGCRLSAYRDAVGIPTIGYGCTAGVQMGQMITQEEADRRLMADLATFEHGVSDAVHVPLTQGQFDACVSFCYNVGGTKFVRSTLLKRINDCNWDGARREFARWDMAGDQHLPGLLTRRMAEATMFANAPPIVGFPDAPLLPPVVTTPVSTEAKPSLLTLVVSMILSLFRK